MHISSTSNILLASTVLAAVATAAGAQERHAYFGQTHQHTSWSLDGDVTLFEV
jgi:hypothetical protein